MELPKEVKDFLSETGRKGGKAKVPKGFAKMDPARLKKVTRKGQKASLKVRKAKARGRRKDNTGAGDTVPGTGQVPGK